ncbi:MAG TPA: LacI family DNA-binding transcriptional regulator [Anaerolineales bacterium]
MTTIYDVAHEAGVSIGTVSYVINNKGSIGPQTTQRVQQAIQKLNYNPRGAAQALARGCTNTVLLVAPLNIYEYQMSMILIIESIGQAITNSDYRLFIHPTLNRPDAWRELEADVGRRQMDGVILMHVQQNDPRVELLRHTKIPFVLIGRCENLDGIYFVDADIEAAVHLGVQHLYDLGHRTIGMLDENTEGGPEAHITRALRDGFHLSLESLNLEYKPEWCLHLSRGPASASQDILQMLAAPDHPTALFAMSDAMVMNAYSAAHTLHYKIPEDLAIIGYADSPLYPSLNPPCSAVFDSIPMIGRIATEMLLTLLYGEEPECKQLLIPPHLVARSSTQPELIK